MVIVSVSEPMIAKKQESNSGGEEKRVYYEVNKYKIFDFIEPEIHPLYVLSVEPEVEIFESIENSFLGNYCSFIPNLKSLKNNRSVNESYISYSNDYAKLVFQKEYGNIFFCINNYLPYQQINYLDKSNDQELIQKAEKFIENYLGGFRKDLKLEKRLGNEINFFQYVDDVKIAKFYEIGINIAFNENNAIFFTRLIFNIEKRELISQQALSPVECIKKSIDFFKNYKDDKWIKFTKVNLVYFPQLYYENLTSVKYKLIPAWEFTNHDYYEFLYSEYIYLNAFTGEVLNIWRGI